MKDMTHWLIVTSIVGGASAGVARAAPYWMAYEGDKYPEEVGWTRRILGGGATRSIEDSTLRIDSLASTEIVDFYRIEREIDPEPGELFVAEWRVRIAQNLNHREAGVTIAPDDPATLSFRYELDRLWSTRENWSIEITPMVFHTYHVESVDMLTYRLWIDGLLVREGQFDKVSFNQSFLLFGDDGQFGGTGSVTEWDYVRFGVVPEAPAGLMFCAVVAICRVPCFRRRRSITRDELRRLRGGGVGMLLASLSRAAPQWGDAARACGRRVIRADEAAAGAGTTNRGMAAGGSA